MKMIEWLNRKIINYYFNSIYSTASVRFSQSFKAAQRCAHISVHNLLHSINLEDELLAHSHRQRRTWRNFPVHLSPMSARRHHPRRRHWNEVSVIKSIRTTIQLISKTINWFLSLVFSFLVVFVFLLSSSASSSPERSVNPGCIANDTDVLINSFSVVGTHYNSHCSINSNNNNTYNNN